MPVFDPTKALVAALWVAKALATTTAAPPPEPPCVFARVTVFAVALTVTEPAESTVEPSMEAVVAPLSVAPDPAVGSGSPRATTRKPTPTTSVSEYVLSSLPEILCRVALKLTLPDWATLAPDPIEASVVVEVVASEKIGREIVTYVSNIYKYYIAYKLITEDAEERRKAREAASKAQ